MRILFAYAFLSSAILLIVACKTEPFTNEGAEYYTPTSGDSTRSPTENPLAGAPINSSPEVTLDSSTYAMLTATYSSSKTNDIGFPVYWIVNLEQKIFPEVNSVYYYISHGDFFSNIEFAKAEEKLKDYEFYINGEIITSDYNDTANAMVLVDSLPMVIQILKGDTLIYEAIYPGFKANIWNINFSEIYSSDKGLHLTANFKKIQNGTSALDYFIVEHVYTELGDGDHSSWVNGYLKQNEESINLTTYNELGIIKGTVESVLFKRDKLGIHLYIINQSVTEYQITAKDLSNTSPK